MESLDSCTTWHCVSTRNEEGVSKIIPAGKAYDNGVCLGWFEETQNLSNASYKPIRDQILQVEHLKLAFALEFLYSCDIRKSDIKFLRADAVILSTPKKDGLGEKGSGECDPSDFESTHAMALRDENGYGRLRW